MAEGLAKARIFVVEDDSIIALELKERLERLDYLVVGVAATGEDAVEKSFEFLPDLVLMDIHLRGNMDGIAAAEAIHARLDMPLIYITANADATTIARAKLTDPYGYVLKQFQEVELRTAIEIALYKHSIGQKLRESDRWLSTTLKSIGDAVMTADAGGRVTFANPVAEAIVGQKAEDLMGKTLSDVFQILDPENEAHVENPVRAVLDTGVVVASKDHVLLARNPDTAVPVSYNVAPIKDERNAIRGIVLIFRDVTARELAEKQIREQAELLDRAQDAISVRDLEGQILYWNKGAERLYGWTAEEAIGKHESQLLYKLILPEVVHAAKEVVQKGEWVGELSQVAKNGTEHIVQSRWTLVRDNKNRPTSILVINTDITEKKQLEVQFLRSQRLESVGTLAGGIAHDLNNVLAPILMATHMLRSKINDQVPHKWIDSIESSVQRGTGIVGQVLTFARGATGKHTVLQSKHLLREMAKIITETFPRSIRLESDIAQNLWTIEGDPTQLHQVFMNLCVNARDAMPHGGTLLLSAANLMLDEQYARMNIEARPGPYVKITVADTGTGIPAGIIDKIFEPFFTTKDVGKGTGLGLSTVHAIVKSHNGFVHVYSEIGRGTRFDIYLPGLEMEGAELAVEEEGGFPEGQGEGILVVDDEALIRTVTEETLQAYHYRPLLAADGAEAVAVYAQHQTEIAVALVDTMMPYMDGPATIRALRRITPEIKIVAMSGAPNGMSGNSGDSSAELLLSKPFTTAQLLETLRKVIHDSPTFVQTSAGS